MKLKITALLIVVSMFLTSSAMSQFDFSRYRSQTIKELIQNYPSRPRLTTIQNIPIRSKVKYLGQFRDLPEDNHSLIVAWTKSYNVPEVLPLFRRELKIEEAGVEYWVAVQEVLVWFMKAELSFREEIELFMVYIGQVDGRHGFLVNEFQHQDGHEDPAKPPRKVPIKFQRHSCSNCLGTVY